MMIILKNGEQIPGACTQISAHVVELTFTDAPPALEDLAGFGLYRDNGELLFDGAGYDTLYRQIDGGYQLSDDGSIYVEPPEPEPLPDPPEEPAGPTLEERMSAVEQVLLNKM